jgi:hypothetical protein
MSKIKDTFFGGAEKKAGRAGRAAAREAAAASQAQIAAEEGRFADVKAQLDPFVAPGGLALQRQAALSGAAGQEAQREAFASFEESPGVQFLREQGLRLIESGSGATGRLGGGDRLRELTKFSQGLALQDRNEQFNQLGAVTGTGLTAASNIGAIGSDVGRSATQGLSGNLLEVGRARAAGEIGSAAGFRSGIESTASLLASDARLKTNIRQIDTLDSGLPWYAWDWKEFALDIVGNQPSEGVMAHEARKLFPAAVVEVDGWLRVDYGSIH